MNLRKRVQNLELKIGRMTSSQDPDLMGLSVEELMDLQEEEIKKIPPLPPPPQGLDLEKSLNELVKARKRGPVGLPW